MYGKYYRNYIINKEYGKTKKEFNSAKEDNALPKKT